VPKTYVQAAGTHIFVGESFLIKPTTPNLITKMCKCVLCLHGTTLRS
jgi:hypothetical protein